MLGRAGPRVLGGGAGSASRRGPLTSFCASGWRGYQNLDPARIFQIENQTVASQIYNGLVNHQATNKIVPDLASEWTVDDGTVYTFKLRSGVVWHKTRAFFADDVKFSLERVLNPERRAL